MEFEQPPVGNTFLQCEQDFGEGAKELNSHSTTVKTSPGYSFLDEFTDDWASITEPSDFRDLEVFNDVILPSEELTTDFELDFLGVENDARLSHSSTPPSPPQAPTSGLTIRLKRVKCKRRFSSKLGVEPVAPLDAITTEWERQRTSAPSCSPLHFSDGLCESRSGICSPSLTLKEVIDSRNADAILANCLGGQGTCSPATLLDDGCSFYDTFLDTRLLHHPSSPTASEDDDYYSSISLRSPTRPSSSLRTLSHPSSSLGSPTPFSVCSLASDSLDFRTAKGGRVKKGRCKMPPEIRYLKKKEQNKEAASRYREKKKRETESIENALHYEDLRRQQLEGDYERVKQEFLLLKKLMREVSIAKRLVPPEAFD